jgi:anaerobic magnesium-protoporphyrin IX monomethyl ester cyclase
MSGKHDVIFINPDSSAKAYQGLATVYSAIEPPTWALLLAESCRSKGFRVGILDCDAEKLSLEQSVRRVEELRPRLIVFVIYGQNPNSGTTSMIGACDLASQLRSSLPEIKIGFIGSHVSALPLEVVQLPYVDIAFINEGVHALLALLKSDLDEALDKIPGIWYKDKHGVARPGAPGIVVSPEQMSTLMPGYAWDLLPKRSKALDLYRAHFWHTNFLHEERTPFAAIYTSLGCQFGCNFCMINIINRTSYETDSTAADSRGMRFWSPELMLGEFEKLWAMGVRTLRISDEMFFLNRQYYVPILEGLIARGLKFNLWAYARVDSVRKDQLELFKAAGVNWLCLGIEAGNQFVRVEIDKGRFQQVDIRQVVSDIKDAKINVLGNYMFGLPEDTIETMTETLDLALELQCEHANFYAAQALPGSPLYLYAKRAGWDLPQRPEEYAFLSYECKPLRTKYLEAAEVLRFRDQAWNRYFSDLGYLGMIEQKFGILARTNIEDLAKIKLKRELLGD